MSNEGPLDREAQSVTSVTPLRLPGAVPPDAHAVALDRLLEAMVLTATVNRSAADAYAMVFKIAAVSAPFGDHGTAVEKILAVLAKRLTAHLATLPNGPRAAS